MNKYIVIAVINRKTSQLLGFQTSGFAHILNLAFAKHYGKGDNCQNPVEMAERLTKTDKDYLYQVWYIEK